MLRHTKQRAYFMQRVIRGTFMNRERLIRPYVFRFAECLAAGLLFCLLAVPSASANEITYSFSGTAVCAPDNTSVCGAATVTVKGTYTLDPSLALTGGPGSVNLAFSFSVSSSDSQFGGFTISSTSPEAFSADIVGSYGRPPNGLIFESNYPAVVDAPYALTVQLAFGSATVDGSVLTGTAFSGVQINGYEPNSFSAVFDFTSGAATPTPEPSSLLLLGAGILGFGPFIRVRRAGRTELRPRPQSPDRNRGSADWLKGS